MTMLPPVPSSEPFSTFIESEGEASQGRRSRIKRSWTDPFCLLLHFSRHGVATPYIKGTPVPESFVKDMYLVPLRSDDSLDFLDLIPNSVLPRVRTQNMLLGVYVIQRTCNELFPPEVLKDRLASPSRLANTDSDSAPRMEPCLLITNAASFHQPGRITGGSRH